MTLDVMIENGKYRVIQDNEGNLRTLRYGEEWRDCCGDNLIYCLAAEVERLREQITTHCPDTLNPSEAVYGFAAWLTCRNKKTVMSDAASIVELVKQFCKVNSLPEVSEQWPNNLIHPSGEVAVPGVGHNNQLKRTG